MTNKDRDKKKNLKEVAMLFRDRGVLLVGRNTRVIVLPVQMVVLAMVVRVIK